MRSPAKRQGASGRAPRKESRERVEQRRRQNQVYDEGDEDRNGSAQTYRAQENVGKSDEAEKAYRQGETGDQNGPEDGGQAGPVLRRRAVPP